MRIAHLILAHRNPVQLKRMLQAMAHPQSDFFIHLDLKINLEQFASLAGEHVFFIRNRVNVRWACYSLVQAQLNGMREIVDTGKYDYINIMSGQDFPLMSPETAFRFLEEHAGQEFISTKTFSDDGEWWEEARYRVHEYHFQNWRIPGKYRLQFLVNRILPRRKYPLDHTIVGRSQWFTITTGCARYILDFLGSHPEVIRFFKYVWGADEFIFSTIVYNSPYKANLRDSLMYTDWSERKPNPKILTTGDFDKLVRSGKLFARKFDMDADANIFTMLEQRAMEKVQYINR